jgi:hypothetical protein
MRVSNALGETSLNDQRRYHAIRNEEPLAETDKKAVVSSDENEGQSFATFVQLHPQDPEFSVSLYF